MMVVSIAFQADEGISDMDTVLFFQKGKFFGMSEVQLFHRMRQLKQGVHQNSTRRMQTWDISCSI